MPDRLLHGPAVFFYAAHYCFPWGSSGLWKPTVSALVLDQSMSPLGCRKAQCDQSIADGQSCHGTLHATVRSRGTQSHCCARELPVGSQGSRAGGEPVWGAAVCAAPWLQSA